MFVQVNEVHATVALQLEKCVGVCMFGTGQLLCIFPTVKEHGYEQFTFSDCMLHRKHFQPNSCLED